jgi:hypothetical protein
MSPCRLDGWNRTNGPEVPNPALWLLSYIQKEDEEGPFALMAIDGVRSRIARIDQLLVQVVGIEPTSRHP